MKGVQILQELQAVLAELRYPKSDNLGPKDGDFNLLNVPDSLYNPATFWDDFNKPWLQKAADRGDVVVVMPPLTITYTQNARPSAPAIRRE